MKLAGSSTAVEFRMIGFVKEEANDQVRQLGSISRSPFFLASISFFREMTDGFDLFETRR